MDTRWGCGGHFFCVFEMEALSSVPSPSLASPVFECGLYLCVAKRRNFAVHSTGSSFTLGRHVPSLHYRQWVQYNRWKIAQCKRSLFEAGIQHMNIGISQVIPAWSLHCHRENGVGRMTGIATYCHVLPRKYFVSLSISAYPKTPADASVFKRLRQWTVHCALNYLTRGYTVGDG